ncbi:MAG: hypothetical protein WDW38_004293 [Sanguina aurantia]
MMKYALAAAVAVLCIVQASASFGNANSQVLVVGNLQQNSQGQIAFQKELNAFLQANIDTANIISAALNLASGITYTASGAVGTASAVIALEIAGALYADSLASLDLELEAFERTFENDLPLNLAAAGRLVEMFSNARAAVQGKPQALAASLFGQSADGVAAANGTAIVGGVIGKKIEAALQSIQDAKNQIIQLLTTKAGKALTAAVSA